MQIAAEDGNMHRTMRAEVCVCVGGGEGCNSTTRGLFRLAIIIPWSARPYCNIFAGFSLLPSPFRSRLRPSMVSSACTTFTTFYNTVLTVIVWISNLQTVFSF